MEWLYVKYLSIQTIVIVLLVLIVLYRQRKCKIYEKRINHFLYHMGVSMEKVAAAIVDLTILIKNLNKKKEDE